MPDLNSSKRLIACALLVVFLFNTTGYYAIFEIMKARIRNEMQVKLGRSGNPLVVLEINTTDEAFLRIDKREFRYQGSLYDVIREVKSGPVSLFYCIHDKKEEHLLATMKMLNTNRVLQLMWEQVIKIAIPQFTMPEPWVCNSDFSYPEYVISCKSAALALDVPPPKCI